jgi:transcriptional regulator
MDRHEAKRGHAMYIPEAFAVADQAILFDFIDRHGFATMVSVIQGVPFATHLPILLDRDRNLLLGHVARANPHWHDFDGIRESLFIFQGPHAYVSPSWYAVAPAVPTWNYAVVHVSGAPRVLADEASLEPILARLVDKYEGTAETAWQYDLPDDYRRKLLHGIVGFEVPIARIEGKFKFGQNRSAEDRRGMLEHLRAGDAEAQVLAAMIAAHLQE